MATWAWRYLGRQGDASTVEIAVEQLARQPFRHSEPRIYLEGLPAHMTLPIARQLVTRSDQASPSMGWTLLGRHAAQTDVPRLYAELVSRVAAADFDDLECVIEGLIRHPGCGPYPAARTCFENTGDAGVRSAAADLLSGSDPRFADELAFECLWDSDPRTRRLAARLIAPTTSEIRDRVASIRAERGSF